ncbi:MAG: BrnA antitoxin family protein [Candidatus Acidiferrales bacterium]
MRKLTKEQKRDIAAIAAKRDADIDFSDIAPVPDWNAAEMGKFYRPAKKPVTMRLDLDVIEWLKAGGRGYQTKANWLLRSAMLHYSRNANLDGDAGTRRLGRGRRRKKKS